MRPRSFPPPALCLFMCAFPFATALVTNSARLSAFRPSLVSAFHSTVCTSTPSRWSVGSLSQRNPLQNNWIRHGNGKIICRYRPLVGRDLSLSADATATTASDANEEETAADFEDTPSPWSKAASRQGKSKARFRQHVNPLARRFQMKTELPSDWPRGNYDDPTLPLHLDIGCGKGGFLLDLATKRRSDGDAAPKMNYLGLEIRPNVARHARERVPRWNLSGQVEFIGCNANVDLRRMLTMYQTNGGGSLGFVSIQFPDPHFKASHTKRRVVTPELVSVLAEFVPQGGEVFLQSDVIDVFNAMRESFREQGEYFVDTVEGFEEYLPENPISVPTEREVSVLDQGLPVYRTVFRRTTNED